MQIPRRLLPSVSLLAAFEAAARTGSVSAAARELHLTQSAVSRQIKALEEQLGAELFVRERQAIRLTMAGDSYARDIRDALRRISMASLNFRANPGGGTLNIASPPTFAARWLSRRLPNFVDGHRDIMLNLVCRDGEPDFRVEPLDAAIYFGSPQELDFEFEYLRNEIVLPVCAPELLRRFNFKQAGDIRQAPMLILVSRPDAWEQWLEAQQAPADDVHGMMFDQFTTLIEATAAGLGVALVPTFLAEDELASARLVVASPGPAPVAGAYYLVWPAERAAYPPLEAFRRWIRSAAAGQSSNGHA